MMTRIHHEERENEYESLCGIINIWDG